jgi:hypothetical protein
MAIEYIPALKNWIGRAIWQVLATASFRIFFIGWLFLTYATRFLLFSVTNSRQLFISTFFFRLMPVLTTLGDYKIGKTIGSGSFSKVKLGTHAITRQKVLCN